MGFINLPEPLIFLTQKNKFPLGTKGTDSAFCLFQIKHRGCSKDTLWESVSGRLLWKALYEKCFTTTRDLYLKRKNKKLIFLPAETWTTSQQYGKRPLKRFQCIFVSAVLIHSGLGRRQFHYSVYKVPFLHCLSGSFTSSPWREKFQGNVFINNGNYQSSLWNVAIASSGSVSLRTWTPKSLLQLFSCRSTNNTHCSSEVLLRFRSSVKKKSSFQFCLYNSWGGNWPGWEFLPLFLSDLYLKVGSQPELELSLETNRSSAPRGLTLWEMPKGCMKDEMVSFTSAQKCERRQFYEEEEAVLPHCFLLFVCLFVSSR